MASQSTANNNPAAQYKRVFSPFRIGKLNLKNRIFIPAHTTNLAQNFRPTDRHVDYHRERARGGAGLIIIEPIRVHRTSLGRAGGLFGNDERAVPGLRRITDVIHAEGIPVFVQINHTGRHGDNFTERLPAWGPSSIPWTTSGTIPHAMTRPEIAEVVRCFVQTAQYAVDAGFDGMEVHFGHGHLLHQFLSPASNDRTDSYGGNFENRLRFPMEVLRAVIEKVASKVEVGVRVSVDEIMPGGLDPEACREIVRRAAAEPGVSFINASVSAYTWPSVGYHVADMSYPAHPYLDLTVALRDVIGKTPLMTANRYVTLADAEEALNTDAIDMVGMMRAHIADPQIIKKTLAGNESRIRPCIASNFCAETLAVHRPLTCMMNPRVGHEAEWPEEPERATTPRKVLIIGAGPAGMEAARVGAKRGHEITVWERRQAVGGALSVAGTGEGRSDLERMRVYLDQEVRLAGANVVLGKDAHLEDILAFKADAIILATGTVDSSKRPDGWASALSVEQALMLDRGSWRGSSACIYDTAGSWAALSAAETLAAAGAQVTLLSKPDSALWDINIYSRMIALERLRERGVFVVTRAEPVRLDGEALIIREVSLGRESLLGKFSHLILSVRGESSMELLGELQSREVAVHCIGDALAPGSLLQAMYDGHAIGRQL